MNLRILKINLQRSFSFVVVTLLFVLNFYAQQITKGPYLLMPTDHEITIRWETDSKAGMNIIYGKKNRLNKSNKASLRGVKEGFYLYEITLENLQYCTNYYYQIKIKDIDTKTHQFKTNCSNKSTFSFVAMGDSRSNPDIFSKIIKNVVEDKPDMIISMGDLVETGGDFKQWDEFYFSIAKNLIDQVPLISTIGDHETNGDNGELFRHFMLTDETTDKQWFSYDYYNAHFISLDYRHANSEEMIEWFINDINKSKAKWKFVYFHRPVYNFGGHRSMWGQDVWAELFHKYKIDIVFAGHSHIYERFLPAVDKNVPNSWPVTYITTGGSGAGLYDVSKSDLLAVAESVNHYVDIKIDHHKLKLVAFRNDGSVLDLLEIEKKHQSHTKDYLDKAIDEKELKLESMFRKKISFTLDYIPFRNHAAPVDIVFKSPIDQDISFKVELLDESAENYKMESVSGVLKKFEILTFGINVFSKTTIKVGGWGSVDPDLRLKLTYRYKGKEYVIFGGAANYWPDIYE
jgi:hypothetical protein